MSDADRDAIRQMLEAHNTITLATCDAGKPWAASLFFASDKHLNLYFVSDYRTQHARHIEECADVVATVNADCALWADVRGLQIAGTCTAVTGLDRVNALRHYLAKFSDVRALFEAPKGDDEETIARRLKAATMYRLAPNWIRLIDNRRWFGYKQELDLSQ
jgi:uncharacterized protein YhbP (UPF0306 family)